MRVRFRDQRARYEGMRTERGVQEYARGEVRRTEGGVTVGAFPSGLVYAEGRVAAILDGAEAQYLADAGQLVAALQVAGERAGVASTELDREPGVGRCDLASELHYADGRDGQDVLRTAASAELPWLKVGTEGGKRGALETVYWRSVQGRSVALRLYDKGRETGLAAPGEWLRLERQRRYRKEREPSVPQLLGGSLREAFVGRELAALIERDTTVTVCDELGAAERIRELVAAGEVTARVGESLLGFLWLRGEGLPSRTIERRESQLRALGLAVWRGEAERHELRFGQVAEAFASSWAA